MSKIVKSNKIILIVAYLVKNMYCYRAVAHTEAECNQGLTRRTLPLVD